MVDPVNYDKQKAKKKFKVIKDLTQSGEDHKSPDLHAETPEDDEFNTSFKMSKQAIYDGAQKKAEEAHNFSF